MKDKQHSEIQQEALLRQRNILYPDTIRNEAEGYRYLLSASKISSVQRIGAVIVGLIFLLLGIAVSMANLFLPRMSASQTDSRAFGAAMIVPALAMVAVGLVFVVCGFRLLKRALGR